MDRETLITKYPFFANVDWEHAFDNLTKVFARHVMKDYMQNLIASNTPFSLFIADIDNFKYVNDYYGHHEGDAVLATLAKFLADNVGTKGVVGRFGGDEFLIVCEGVTEYNDVWEIGHRINLNIAELKFPESSVPSVTITMGIARFPLDACDYSVICSLADKALYIGKTKGRNRFIIYLESKHKSIDLKERRQVAFSPVHLHSKIFSTLTGSADLATAIKNQLIFLASYNMYDHVCIETESGMRFNILHAMSRVTSFKPMNCDDLEKVAGNVGLASINQADAIGNRISESIQAALDDQSIKSSVYCRINAYGKTYGFIRIDMTTSVRIWQNEELALIIDTANTIGILLHYNNVTIGELDSGEKTELIGGTQS